MAAIAAHRYRIRSQRYGRHEWSIVGTRLDKQRTTTGDQAQWANDIRAQLAGYERCAPACFSITTSSNQLCSRMRLTFSSVSLNNH